MIKVRFSVLEVGQGSCNFVELFVEGVLTTTFLLDCGSQTVAGKGAKASVAYVVERLNTMDEPQIAAVVLSHKDKDHISLIPSVFSTSKFNQPTSTSKNANLKDLTVDGIFISGGIPDYVFQPHFFLPFVKFNSVRVAAGFLNPQSNRHIGVQGFPYNFTQFSKYPADNFWPWPDAVAPAEDPPQVVDELIQARIGLSALIANTHGAKGLNEKLEDIEKKGTQDPNAGCVVAAVVSRRPDARDVLFVATADATALTLAKANELTKNLYEDYFVYHVTAPHHGSFRTTLGSAGRRELKPRTDIALRVAAFGKGKRPAEHHWEIDEQAKVILDAFVGNLKPATVSASSQITDWGHPSLAVLERFVPHLKGDADDEPSFHDDRLGDDDRHFITVYVDEKVAEETGRNGTSPWPLDQGYKTIQTTDPIFTTLYVADFDEARRAEVYLYEIDEDLTTRDVTQVSPPPDKEHPFVDPVGTNWVFTALPDGTDEIEGWAHDQRGLAISSREVAGMTQVARARTRRAGAHTNVDWRSVRVLG